MSGDQECQERGSPGPLAGTSFHGRTVAVFVSPRDGCVSLRTRRRSPPAEFETLAQSLLRLATIDGNSIAMSITTVLGKAGRLVVPKTIRDNLGLREGTRLRIVALAGKIEVIPEADDVRIQFREGLPVITGGRARTRGDIVKAIKASREERAERILTGRKRE